VLHEEEHDVVDLVAADEVRKGEESLEVHDRAQEDSFSDVVETGVGADVDSSVHPGKVLLLVAL